MTDIVVDVFPPNVAGALSVDPGDRLVRLTKQELMAGSRFKYVKLGTGDATIIIPADIPEAAALVDDALLQWWDLDLSSTVPLGVSTLEKGGMKVIGSRRNDRVITWNGLGGLALFARAMLLKQWYALGPPVQVARGSENRDGIWWWINQPFGAILRRTYEEGRDQPGTPLAGITANFTRELDSAGVEWTIIEQEFQRQWGTNGLELLEVFMRAGVIPLLRGDLQLDAYETYGTDRSGAAFGAGVLRFTDENITGELDKAIAAHERVSHLFVRGADNETVVVTDPTAPARRYGLFDYPESNDPAILTKVGTNAITSKRLLTDSARFQIYDGNDPMVGRYRLGPPGSGGDGWVGDTLTMNSGVGQHHYVEQDMPLAAVEYRLLGASGWGTFVEAGTVYLDGQAREINEVVRSIAKNTTARPHSHPEMLCQALVASSTPPTVESDGRIDTGAQAIVVPSGLTDSVLVVVGAWDDDSFPYSGTYGSALTAIAGSQIGSAGDAGESAFYFPNPPADPTAAGTLLQVVDSGAGGTQKGWWVLSGYQSIGNVVTATGTGTSATVHIPGTGMKLFAAFQANGSSTVDPIIGGGATESWKVNAASGLGRICFIGGYGSDDPVVTFDESQPWVMVGIEVSGPSASNGGRHPDLNGTDPEAAHCDHGHVAHETGTPGVSDDSRAGFVRGDFWAVVDDATTPTAITAVYVCLDASEGAAVWIELPGGGSHPDLGAHDALGLATDAELGVVASALTDHLTDAIDAHDASAISADTTGFTNSTGDDVQEVLADLDLAISAGGIPATIFDAAGDIIVASAADTAARLPLGAALQHLRVNVGATGLEYADPPSPGAGGGSGRALVDPTGLSWSWRNQGSATINTHGAALVLYAPADSSDAQRMRVKAVPTKPYQIIVHATPSFFNVNFSGWWVGWLNDGVNFTGLYQLSVGGGLNLNSTKGPIYAANADYVALGSNFEHWEWIRLTDDATNRRIYVSRTGLDDSWILFHSVATNDFLTPTHVGFSVNPRNATYPASLVVDSWEEL